MNLMRAMITLLFIANVPARRNWTNWLRLVSCSTIALVLFSAEFGYADARMTAAATVYKVGVNFGNGRFAMGSAVQVAPGKLVTSCHTTRGASRIFVLHREGQLSAKAMQSDSRHDVCILEVPELRGPVPPRVASTQLAVGQATTAIGFGGSYSVSREEGQITALYRFDDANVVRTSASFPKGASGGGLFDEQGRLVGILTFRASVDRQLNYAVPAEWVDRLLSTTLSQEAAAKPLVAFWEDDAADQPIFLRAAWLEYANQWTELEVLAVNWALEETDNSEAWLALGRSKVALEQHREAVLALRQAVALDPANTRAWFWLASAYRAIGFDRDFMHASIHLEQLDPRLALQLKDSLSSPSN